MSLAHGRPEPGPLSPGETVQSAQGAAIVLPHGRPRQSLVPPRRDSAERAGCSNLPPPRRSSYARGSPCIAALLRRPTMSFAAALHRHLRALATRRETLEARIPWPRATLRTYLVAAMLLATVPIALLMAWQVASDLIAQQSRTEASLRRQANSLAQEVERELVSSIDALSILAQSESLQRGDVGAFARALATRSLLRPTWAAANLIDREGRVVFDTADPEPPPGKRPLASARFAQVLQEGRPQVSDLVGDGQSGKAPHDSPYATAVEVPVVVDGAPRFVLRAWIDTRVWQELVERAAPPEQGFLSVYDREFRLVARTLAAQRLVGSSLPAAAKRILRREAAGLERFASIDGDNAYIAWHTVPMAGWGVAVGLHAEPIEVAQREAIAAAIITAGACLLLGVSLALWLARRVTQPLDQLASQGAGQPPTRIAVREIAVLRDALVEAYRRDEQVHRQLEAKAKEFETLFAGSPIGLAFAQDAQCRVVMHNAAMDALVGPPEGAGDTQAVEMRFRGRVLERSEQPLHMAAAWGQAVSAMEMEIRVPGRASVFVIANATPLADAEGRPRGAIGAMVDIGERKRAEARLLAADEQLRASQRLVDLAQQAGHVGFFNYHFGSDELVWTPGQAMLFGVPAQAGSSAPRGQAHRHGVRQPPPGFARGSVAGEPLASTLQDFVSRVDADDRAAVGHTLRGMLAARQETGTLEFRVPLEGGAVRWLSSRLLVSYGEHGRPLQMVGITLDMTEQKVAENARAELVAREQAARLEAETSNRAKDEFLAMLGHELRNPLSAITSAAELLHRVDARAEVAKNARAVITRQTRHLARLMDDLLDVGRVISGKILLSRSATDLALVVRRHVGAVELTGNAAAHRLELDLNEAWVDADPTRLEQIVNNLLTNAIKYTPAGGRIEVRVRREGDEAVLTVADTGVGIPEALLPRIFDLFVQGERTLDRRAGGLGVGLTLVRRLVELHGGSIAVQSPRTDPAAGTQPAEPSGTDGPAAAMAGSVFTMRLPAIEAPTRRHEWVHHERMRKLRVLVIEDNADALSTLCAMLELDGHTVATAADGESGLATLLELRPDAAIIDIGLPGLTGYEVAKRSRAAGHAGRMIAVSGYGQPQDVKRSLHAGFDAHLVKPVAAKDLQALLAAQ